MTDTIIDARFEGQVVTFTVKKTDGQQIRKKVRIDQFIDLIQTATDSCRFRRIGHIPDGLVDFSIGDRAGHFKAVFMVPAGIRMLPYYGEVFTVPFPETVFFLSTQSGRVVESKVFSKKGSRLYHYPFGNVYSDGRICWGGTSLPSVQAISDMKKIPALFYGGDTNNDLYQVGTNVIRKDIFTHQRGLIHALKDLQEFPTEWLVPIDGTTFDAEVDSYLV